MFDSSARRVSGTMSMPVGPESAYGSDNEEDIANAPPERRVEVFSNVAGGWTDGVLVDPVEEVKVTVQFMVDGILHRKTLSVDSKKLHAGTGFIAGGPFEITDPIPMTLNNEDINSDASSEHEELSAQQNRNSQKLCDSIPIHHRRSCRESRLSISSRGSRASSGSKRAWLSIDSVDENLIRNIQELMTNIDGEDAREGTTGRKSRSSTVRGSQGSGNPTQRLSSCGIFPENRTYKIPGDADVEGVLLAPKVKYWGSFSGGAPHGEGRMRWPDGREYFGVFHNGLRAQGTMVWDEDLMYTGQWHNNKAHGIGTCRVKNGGVWHGRWENGAPRDEQDVHG